jgi:hypothetical protein
LKRAATAKKQGGAVRLKFAPKPENKTYDHFTPISGQASALFPMDVLLNDGSSNSLSRKTFAVYYIHSRQ